MLVPVLLRVSPHCHTEHWLTESEQQCAGGCCTPGRELCLCSAAPALLLRENQQQCVGVSSLTMICAKQTFRSIPPTGYEI